jgi:hypothetical protein
MAMTVDEFVATKVPSEFQPIVDVIRELMREYAPDVREAIGYGMPVYKQKKIFAWISPSKKDITFGFSHGTEMEDKYRLLHGVGKGARHVKMKNLGEVNKAALRYYVRQAMKIDKS